VTLRNLGLSLYRRGGLAVVLVALWTALARGSAK
jgi:hypothetical protein